MAKKKPALTALIKIKKLVDGVLSTKEAEDTKKKKQKGKEKEEVAKGASSFT